MYIAVIFGAVLGALSLLSAFFAAGAPQQAALAAMACAFCVIPYVGFRASQLSDDAKRMREFRAEVLEALKSRPPAE